MTMQLLPVLLVTGDSRQTAQGGVIAPLQNIPSLCEQRGEDDPSHSRQGCEDVHVMLLRLPRFGFLRRDSRAVRTSSWLWASFSCSFTRRLRAISVVTCALAASTVPAARCTGCLRNTRRTWAASKRRMRLHFSTSAL
jgi:hypothetical protein